MQGMLPYIDVCPRTSRFDDAGSEIDYAGVVSNLLPTYFNQGIFTRIVFFQSGSAETTVAIKSYEVALGYRRSR